MKMQQYTYEIVPRKGKLHANADAMSRKPFASDPKPISKQSTSTGVSVSMLTVNTVEHEKVNNESPSISRSLTEHTTITARDDKKIDITKLSGFAKEQRRDPKLAVFFDYLEGREHMIPKNKIHLIRMQILQIFLHDGVLYHIHEGTDWRHRPEAQW